MHAACTNVHASSALTTLHSLTRNLYIVCKSGPIFVQILRVQSAHGRAGPSDYVAPTSGTTKTPNKSLLIWLLVVPLVLNKQFLISRDPLRRLVGPVVSPHLSKPAGRVIESQY